MRSKRLSLLGIGPGSLGAMAERFSAEGCTAIMEITAHETLNLGSWGYLRCLLGHSADANNTKALTTTTIFLWFGFQNVQLPSKVIRRV